MYCIFNYLHRFSPRFLIDVLLNAFCVSFLSCGWRSFWYLSGESMGGFLCLIKSRCFPTFTLRLTNLPYLPDFLRYLSLSPPYGRDFLLFTGINLNVYKIVYIILFFRYKIILKSVKKLCTYPFLDQAKVRCISSF